MACSRVNKKFQKGLKTDENGEKGWNPKEIAATLFMYLFIQFNNDDRKSRRKGGKESRVSLSQKAEYHKYYKTLFRSVAQLRPHKQRSTDDAATEDLVYSLAAFFIFWMARGHTRVCHIPKNHLLLIFFVVSSS
jgi:hypothetical protein